MYKMVATSGNLLHVLGLAYHLKETDICLFSPQTYHQRYDGQSHVDENCILIELPQQPDLAIHHDIKIPINIGHSNLTIIKNVACYNREKQEIGPYFKPSINHTYQCMGMAGCAMLEMDEDDDFEYEFGILAQILDCVTTGENKT